MLETRPFKTKLCILYQRGRCERQTCTFAHGNNELRHFSGAFTEVHGRTTSVHYCVTVIIPWDEKPINRGDDLRNKLDRKRSPEVKYSPGIDSRGSHAFRRFSPPPPHKRRKYRTHFNVDGQNDFQMTFRSSDGTPDRNKDKNVAASVFRITLPDELKQVQDEVDMLLDQNFYIKIQLDERVQESDSLTSRIMDLEAQLSEEKDKFRRVNSKIKTLIRAHANQSRLQDQTKRSQLQLEQLVEELAIDATQIDADEDHLNVNIISDEEIPELDPATPGKRPLTSSMEVPQGYKSGNTVRGNGLSVEALVKSSHLYLDGNKDVKLDNKKENSAHPPRENKSRRRKDSSKSFASSDKLQISESYLIDAPPTSMAAHAVDDFTDLIEADVKMEGVEFVISNQSGVTYPIPPLPSPKQNNYLQYEGHDENVNVDEIDAEF